VAGSVTGLFDGLIASGVHTNATCMRLYVDHYISHAASLAQLSTRSAGRGRVTACASVSR